MLNKGQKVTIVEKIQHNGEINRVRYCPDNPKLIAVSTGSGDINLTTLK